MIRSYRSSSAWPVFCVKPHGWTIEAPEQDRTIPGLRLHGRASDILKLLRYRAQVFCGESLIAEWASLDYAPRLSPTPPMVIQLLDSPRPWTHIELIRQPGQPEEFMSEDGAVHLVQILPEFTPTAG
jgi:hypothetical protein